MLNAQGFQWNGEIVDLVLVGGFIRVGKFRISPFGISLGDFKFLKVSAPANIQFGIVFIAVPGVVRGEINFDIQVFIVVADPAIGKP